MQLVVDTTDQLTSLPVHQSSHPHESASIELGELPPSY